MDKPESSKPMNPETEVNRTTPEAPQPNGTGASQPMIPGHVPRKPDWRQVAAAAATETDPQKLSNLVDELIRLLDEERRSTHRSRK